jgi:formylglycine-generating enzyme required for sulfatase activity
VQALQRQAAEALGLPVFFRHKLKSGGEGPEMVVIPAGAFEMGLNDGRGHEKPVHRVDVPGFAIGRLPITVAEYSKFRMVPDDNEDDARPVVNVTWEEAREYCAWLSRETDQAYRLPSEAEWEYACRAGAAGRWYWGDDSGAMDRYAWYRGNSEGKTHPVGEKQPNAFGLHDMLGNVWEWCEDAWHDDYRGSPANGGAWSKGSEAGYRINRGGSSGDSAWVVCCAERGAEFFNLRFDYRGFRVVLAEILPGVS